MNVYAIDPGTEESALVEYDSTQRIVRGHLIAPNNEVMAFLYTEGRTSSASSPLVIEQFESFGMAVGREVFRTVWWSGRMYEVWTGPKHMMPRRLVKSHICHNTRATDANIRQELLDRFGGRHAQGTKKQPGPLYGIRSHEFAALALAITFAETHAEQ